MHYIVYLLFSEKDKGLYVGHTDRLAKRFKEHNNGKVKSTRGRRPLILIHKEIFGSRKEAIRREKFLKSLYGAQEKQKIVKNFYRTARLNYQLI